MMRGKVLKPFRYSADGVTAIQLEVGDERDFADDMAPGLLKEGWIAEFTQASPSLMTRAEAPSPAAAPEATAAITDQPAPAPAQSKRGRK